MIKGIKRIFGGFLSIFKKRKSIKLGVYGPPNAGKCLTPDTSIIFYNGEIKILKELFDEVKCSKSQFSKTLQLKDFEEAYIECSDLNILVPSLDPNSLKIVPKKLQFVYAQKYKGQIYKITTKSGRIIEGTYEHPIIKISNEGIKFTKLSKLKVKDKIAMVNNIQVVENENFNNNTIQITKKIITSNYNSDEIKSIEVKDYDDYVYDITIEDTHTFLLSNGLISGNSSLSNRICKDWLGEEMSSVSPIPHETREIIVKEKITIKSKGKELTFNLVDTPGIATKIDYEDFLKFKMSNKDAKDRAKEATKGVIEAIKWLDNMDCVLVVLDATQNPYSQVNITIIGNLAARNIPVLIVANKIDLRKSDVKRVESAFPQYPTIGISATNGNNLENFYDEVFKLIK